MVDDLVAVAGVGEAGGEPVENGAAERLSVVVREDGEHLHGVLPSITGVS